MIIQEEPAVSSGAKPTVRMPNAHSTRKLGASWKEENTLSGGSKPNMYDRRSAFVPDEDDALRGEDKTCEKSHRS